MFIYNDVTDIKIIFLQFGFQLILGLNLLQILIGMGSPTIVLYTNQLNSVATNANSIKIQLEKHKNK